jgi:signal transduction histidine kinase
VAQHTSDLHQLIIAAAIALALMAVVSLALGWLVASHFLVPLRAITSTTRDISATNLHERLNIAGPDDEIKELADTFDDLLERLEQAFDFERQFVANASHELRTPLATMRASLDVAMAKPGPVPPPMTVLDERLRRELDHVDRLLDSFLSLARAQRGPATDEALVSLDEAVVTAIGHRSGAIWNKGLSVDQQLCRGAWARGSATLLAHMVDNVVDNAVNHNEQGGWLRAQTSSDGAFVRLTVENGGAVLARDDVNELARPFRRLGAERTGSERGSGLGLSIVRSITKAHGGVLELQARDGGGLRVVITLPRAKGSTVGTPA